MFRGDSDKDHFLACLGKIIPDTQSPCYAWALMPNHLHLLLKTGTVPVYTVMRRLLTSYAWWFNRKHNRWILGLFGEELTAARRACRPFVEKGVGQGRRQDLTGGGLLRSAGGWEGVKALRQNMVLTLLPERARIDSMSDLTSCDGEGVLCQWQLSK